jgi:Cas3, HD domain
MLIGKLKTNLGKSAHGGQTLYDHLIGSAKVAHRVLTDYRFAPPDYPKHKRDQLLFSTFIHDIGKLDCGFQAMLVAARAKEPLPSKRVKHEASTLDFEQLLRESEDEIKTHLGHVLGYQFTGKIDIDDALAFALGHHGLFHLSFEARNGEVLRRVRRDTTVFGYGEQRRITLTDLLFDYHPLGGLVMIADLLASFCYEQRVEDSDDIIWRAKTFGELINLAVLEGIADKVEESIKRYDPRTYGLRELLTLLAGGLA